VSEDAAIYAVKMQISY